MASTSNNSSNNISGSGTNNLSGASISGTISSNNSNNNNSGTARPVASVIQVDRDSRWYFTADQLSNSPSRRHGIDSDTELSYRQLTAYLIQEMGQKLSVTQLCINTAIVYMHRFYTFHSFTHFHRNGIAAASLFLAAKVEEQPRKLEHVIKVAHICLNQESPHPSTEMYAEQAQDLVFNENVLLQTLGFDVFIDHPHTHVVRTCHLVKACKDLAQTSYFLASNSLHLTSMCLQYRPTVVACFCIYLACKWSRWEIPQSTEGRHWFHYVDRTVTMDLLKQLTDEFIAIYEKSPARLKSKLNNIKALAQGALLSQPSRSSDSNISSAQSQMDLQLEQFKPQQSRRSESSHHHRPHHSSHHQHHSGKHDTAEHKHKQSFSSSATNSHTKHVRSDTTSSTQYPAAAMPNNNKTSSTRLNSGTNSNRTVVLAPTSQSTSALLLPQNLATTPSNNGQRGQQFDGTYHKSRSSNINTGANNIPVAHLNSQIPTNHPKLITKQSDRHVINRQIETNPKIQQQSTLKHSNLSNNSLYAPPSSMIPPQLNVGVDMTRNVLQQQSSSSMPSQRYVQNAHNNSQMNYQQQNMRIVTNKYDQQQSVQQQQQSQQQQISQSNLLKQSYESSGSQFIGGEQMEICSPPKYSTMQPQLMNNYQSHQQQQQQQGSQKTQSIFSPDWSIDKQIQSTKPNAFNTGRKESPKKLSSVEKDKRSTPKKDKRLPPSEQFDSSKLPQFDNKRNKLLNVSQQQNLLQQQQQQQQQMPSNFNFPSQAQQQSQSINFAMGSSNTSKRSMNDSIKTEDEHRDNKVRKIDSVDGKPYLYDQTNYYQSQQQKTFPSTTVVNGIETNPDLVSSLLKESLCTENKFSATNTNTIPTSSPSMQECLPKFDNVKLDMKTDIKSEYSFNDIDQQLPLQLLQDAVVAKKDIDMPATQLGMNSTINPLINQGSNVGAAVQQSFMDPTNSSNDEYNKAKSEKKKKKEKHKHKEKDKSKDKEERKKHKKDKDKNRERLSSGEGEPVKIKISKDKLTSLPAMETPKGGGFKIKIPKDRIKGDINQSFMSDTTSNSLKIKISKDKIENYNQSDSTGTNNLNTVLTSGNNHSSGSNSSKKKERDKDREKKRSNNDLTKQNGGSSSSKSQSNSSKNQHFSQLFGESNDDDDDYIVNQYGDNSASNKTQQYLQSYKSSSLHNSRSNFGNTNSSSYIEKK